MSLVDQVKDALTRVATEVNALHTVDAGLAQAIIDLDQAVADLEADFAAQPKVIISATAPTETANVVWIDTSGG